LGAIPEEGFKRLPQAISEVKQKHPDEIPEKCGINDKSVWLGLDIKL